MCFLVLLVNHMVKNLFELDLILYFGVSVFYFVFLTFQCVFNAVSQLHGLHGLTPTGCFALPN